MGAFAAWLNGALPLESAKVDTRPERTLVVADFEPTPAYLLRCLGFLPGWIALPVPPASPLDGVHYCRWQPATNPLRWDDQGEAAFKCGVDTVAFFLPPLDVWGKTLLQLHRAGVKRVVLFEDGRPRLHRPLVLASRRKCQALTRRVFQMIVGPTRPLSEAACREVLAAAPARRPAPLAGQPLRIAHFICSLNSGGAERQVCYAAVAQKRAGHKVRVLTRVPLQGEHAHYRYLLEPHGIAIRQIGSVWDDAFPGAWLKACVARDFQTRWPRDLALQVSDLLGELLLSPVDVLHCYVDDCNVPGALAALLAGVPGVVLSFRNGNPSHFPGLLRDWMLPSYRALLGRPGVVLSSNSAGGARDYERWLGLPQQTVPVVRNAFHPAPTPPRDQALAWRRQHGIADSAPLVLGVFRLHPEKRPLLFLDCIRRIRDRVPNLRVAVAGVGVLEEAVRQHIAALGLSDVVLLLGQQQNVPLLMAASDVLLLVSNWEGTPNTLLEAQHFGCVPVATDAGGSREALSPGETGLLLGQDDVDGICAAVVKLLSDPRKCREMAEAGRAFVGRTFAPHQLDAGNLALYDLAFGREAVKADQAA